MRYYKLGSRRKDKVVSLFLGRDVLDSSSDEVTDEEMLTGRTRFVCPTCANAAAVGILAVARGSGLVLAAATVVVLKVANTALCGYEGQCAASRYIEHKSLFPPPRADLPLFP